MKTFFGSIYHTLFGVSKAHIAIYVLAVLSLLVLGLWHTQIKGDAKRLKQWRIASIIPAILALIHFVIVVVVGKNDLAGFIPVYALAVFALIAALFGKRKIGYRIFSFITACATVVSFFAFILFSSPYSYDFSDKSYTESFHLMAQAMDKTYVLKEWKDVDFKALEDKYMPMVEEAEREENPAKFSDAVKMFANELHDGHVHVGTDYDEDKYPSVFKNNEYGLCMVKLDNDEVIAVNTLPEVKALGIEDGTVITKWNGKPVDVAAEQDVPDMGVPVKENAEFMSYMHLSTYGDENVEVSYIDKEGNEKTVTLNNLGKSTIFAETLSTYIHVPNVSSMEEARPWFEENFKTKMLTEDVGYLRLNYETLSMASVPCVKDMVGFWTGDHKAAREIFRKGLKDLKAQGMKYLVIDLRGNMGGYDEIGCALASLLTDDYYFGQGLGIRKNGKYIDVSPDHAVHGTGEFADIQAVALTNLQCVSAGDGTSLYLSKLPNVTLAGITDPNGSNQETGGSCVLSGGIAEVSYPVGLIMNENDEPNIDVKADRISRNPVEVHIPFDKDAAMKMFSDGEDYELNWAIDYLTGANYEK
ncbi:MAG: hypothetical protein J5802_11930 [Butyrivibrio sp.]|nr:hypothetical protein [Butyrivibrio sp.]